MSKQDRVFDYLTSRQLPTGRRIFVLMAVQRVAADYGLDGLVELCEDAIAEDEKVLELERRYQRQQKYPASRGRGEAASVDRSIDSILGGMHAIAEGNAISEDDVAQKARYFLAEVYPVGLAGLVRLPFEEQLAVEETLLKRFDGDLAEHVEVLGLKRHVEQLRALVPEFRAELEKSLEQPITYGGLKEARAASLDRFAAVVFGVLAQYSDQSEEDRKRRWALLAEYHRQNDIVAKANRGSRVVTDIDPETGEDMGEEEVIEEDLPEPVE